VGRYAGLRKHDVTSRDFKEVRFVGPESESLGWGWMKARADQVAKLNQTVELYPVYQVEWYPG